MLYKNNPANIRYTGQKWLGLCGFKNGFCEFDHIGYGIRSLGVILRTYRSKHHLYCIRDIITRYAPPSENNTDAYINYVCSCLCCKPDFSLHTLSDYANLISAICQYESGFYISAHSVENILNLYEIEYSK